MRHVVKLECIGDDQVAKSRLWQGVLREVGVSNHARSLLDWKPRQPWIAEIVGIDSRFGLQRIFLQGAKDYSHGNSIGSRGIYKFYSLEEGKIYEVNELQTWRRSERYFCRFTNGRMEKLAKNEVVQCLSDRSA